MKYLVFLGITLSSLIVSTLQAKQWPTMPVPKDAEVAAVSTDMKYNGTPMKTWALTFDGDKGALVNHFRNQWKNVADSLYDEQSHGGWVFINSKQGDFLLTAKLQSQLGRSQGYLGISDLSQIDPDFVIGKGFPKPRSTNAITEITENDTGKKSRYIILNSKRSVGDVYRFYIDTFQAKGWEVSVASLDPKGGGGVIALNDDKQEMNLTLTKMNSATQVSANIVTKTLFFD
ncbi:hypothetical protein ACUR5C_05405 [Aliikangiella sp. IMCC44653]